MPKEPELTPEEIEYLMAVREDIDRLIRLNLMGEITDEELDERLASRWRKRRPKRRRKGNAKK